MQLELESLYLAIAAAAAAIGGVLGFGIQLRTLRKNLLESEELIRKSLRSEDENRKLKLELADLTHRVELTKLTKEKATVELQNLLKGERTSTIITEVSNEDIVRYGRMKMRGNLPTTPSPADLSIRVGGQLSADTRYADAIFHFHRHKIEYPNDLRANYSIGVCYWRMRDFDNARSEFDFLLERLRIRVGETDLDLYIMHGCYIWLARLSAASSDYVNARQCLLESLAVEPENNLTYLELALTTWKAGQHAEARRWYATFLLNPESKINLLVATEEDKAHLQSISFPD